MNRQTWAIVLTCTSCHCFMGRLIDVLSEVYSAIQSNPRLGDAIELWTVIGLTASVAANWQRHPLRPPIAQWNLFGGLFVPSNPVTKRGDNGARCARSWNRSPVHTPPRNLR